MEFDVSAGSPMLEPLRRFLNLSSPLDEDLLIVIMDTSDLAKLALKGQDRTDNTIRSLRSISHWNLFESMGICLLGTSSQERVLYVRLVEHTQTLIDAIVPVDRKIRRLLEEYLILKDTTRDISNAAVEDRQLLLPKKQEAAAKFSWLLRLAIQALALPEPQAVARISKNIEMAQGIHEWSHNVVIWLEHNVVVWLEHMSTEIRYAKLYTTRLMEILREQNSVKWSNDDQEHELNELRAQWADGLSVLQNNTAARQQLMQQGYF